MRKLLLFPAALATAAAILPGAAQATSTTCTTSAVCAEYINTYSGNSGGVAIHGESNGGIGIRGTSVSNVGFYGASGGGTRLTPGVEGEATGSNGAGVGGGFGLAYLANKTKAPSFGVEAFGASVGIEGQATGAGMNDSSYGIYGIDGVTSASTSGDHNAGVVGSSPFGTAMLAEAGGGPTEGIDGTVPIGVYSTSTAEGGTPGAGSYAFFGESDSTGLQLDNTGNGDATQVMNGGYFVDGLNSESAVRFYVDDNGNEGLAGVLETSKGTYVRATGRSGASVREYTDRTTTPQVEDVGDGQLVGGRAYVPIDAHLADTIDRRAEYHVFVTPEGDCNGLFVTQKSSSGFAVRELRGGRSSLAFEYRIVAKPVDDNGTRLPAMPAALLPKSPAFEHVSKRERIAPPLSIEDDVKRRLGPEGYAKALATLRARLAGR